MKKKVTFILRLTAAIVTISAILIFSPWQEALYSLSPLPATVQEQVDDAVDQGIDGIIVYIQKAENAPELYASGWHDREALRPASPNALFKIASIGKLYKASATAKLVASGELALDETLAHYLPDLAARIAYADEITLRMLVQHRSGIPNFTDHKDFDWATQSLDALDMVLDSPADFKPDSDYRYSNTNYLLLGKIMDSVLGYDHTQYIQAQILDPLNLTQTFFSVNDVDLDRLMSGYHIGHETDFKTLEQGYVATAQDVGIFLRALNDGTLFTDTEQALYSSLYEYEHTGWVLGHSSRAHYFKDIDTVVIQFVNTTGDDTIILTKIIYDRIIKILKKRS
ncbi:CubicO group peptidase (beta-lactamase class C family) [Litorimonas taeanensis]|uniref:CubicO group peptidase (Beta-lactamase class C family) n=1 Tax=Litorimonas taeanensis TaxID=568099 RepID=A0A420WIV2_9PROT|nr:serine hydrolase domain-containing protein [Litorimonas taeanensis]RKQ70950.1 CubicO group peptidase (beta-lactamase class C family) [Litorimonas taeanensis]